MIRIKLIIIAGMLACAMSACSDNQPGISNELEASFRDMVSISDLNTSLHVRVLSENQTESNFGSDINLVVENMSNSPVFFATNPPGIKVFVIRGNRWVQIGNDVEYSSLQGGNGSVLSPKGEALNELTTLVRPTLGVYDQKKREIVRILIIGQYVSNGQPTETVIGAYVDLFMNP